MLDATAIRELRSLCFDAWAVQNGAVRALVIRVREVCDVSERARAGLTKRELQVLDTITDFVRDQGHRPSLQQVADELDVTKETIHEYVWRLRRKGLLRTGKAGERCGISPA